MTLSSIRFTGTVRSWYEKHRSGISEIGYDARKVRASCESSLGDSKGYSGCSGGL
jgi:hypothetical protein